MHIFKHKIFLCVGMMCLLFALSNESKAQNISFRYNYKLDLSNATEAPQFSAFPEFAYPDAARKNGVEGTLKLTLDARRRRQSQRYCCRTGLAVRRFRSGYKRFTAIKISAGKARRQTDCCENAF